MPDTPSAPLGQDLNREGFGQSKTAGEGPGLEAAKLLTVELGQREEAREDPLVEGSRQMADPFQELAAQLFRAAGHLSCLALTDTSGWPVLCCSHLGSKACTEDWEGEVWLRDLPPSVPAPTPCSHCLTHAQSVPSPDRSCARHHFGCHAAFIRYPPGTAIGCPV